MEMAYQVEMEAGRDNRLIRLANKLWCWVRKTGWYRLPRMWHVVDGGVDWVQQGGRRQSGWCVCLLGTVCLDVQRSEFTSSK